MELLWLRRWLCFALNHRELRLLWLSLQHSSAHAQRGLRSHHPLRLLLVLKRSSGNEMLTSRPKVVAGLCRNQVDWRSSR